MKNFKYIFFFVLGFSFTSCTETITLELEDPEPVLVVDGHITNYDTAQYVKLSSLDNYFAEQPPNYSIYKNATVALIEDSVNVGNFAFNSNNQRFEIQYQGKIGSFYQIDIVLPDGSAYLSAAEKMEEPIPIDTIWYEVAEADGINNEESDIIVFMNTQEPSGTGDNYQWKSYVNNIYNFLAQDLFFADDRIVDGQYVEEFEVYVFSKEEYDEAKNSSPTSQVVVKIEQTKISSRYLKYISLVSQQILQVGSPFAAPPAEIRGNVYKKGENEVLALGYFYSSSVSTAQIEIVE